MAGIGRPLRSKKVDGFREEVVVNKPGVDREQAHKKYDVPTAKDDIPDLEKHSTNQKSVTSKYILS